jgi:alpha-1,6-mannosyltransferase
VLGSLNAASLLYYISGVRNAYGEVTAIWFVALQASQFHIMYYASRTLPNMLAFGLSECLP